MAQLSARNQIRGTVKSIKKDGLMAEVVLDVAGQEVVAVITADSVRRLNLETGQEVFAVIKATEVMVAKP